MSAAPAVSVVVPTCRRPQPLALAVRSVFAQTGVDPAATELVVVDNDPAGSAADAAAVLAAEAPFPLRYVHEPTPGVASARNTGVAAAAAGLIAFLDDDEEASPGWLAALLQAQARFDADVVFGPVRGMAPSGVRRHRAYLEALWSREGPAEAGADRARLRLRR
ncbi:MAG: glycosyltransferase family 2 protein [Caulobacteraceae bacterium]